MSFPMALSPSLHSLDIMLIQTKGKKKEEGKYKKGMHTYLSSFQVFNHLQCLPNIWDLLLKSLASLRRT